MDPHDGETMFELAVKAHGLLGHHIATGLNQNASWHPLGPNEVPCGATLAAHAMQAACLERPRRAALCPRAPRSRAAPRTCRRLIRRLIPQPFAELFELDARGQRLAATFRRRRRLDGREQPLWPEDPARRARRLWVCATHCLGLVLWRVQLQWSGSVWHGPGAQGVGRRQQSVRGQGASAARHRLWQAR